MSNNHFYVSWVDLIWKKMSPTSSIGFGILKFFLRGVSEKPQC